MPKPQRSLSKMMRTHGRGLAWAGLLAAVVSSGCSAAHYRTSADREVHKILRAGEVKHLGKTNDFNIDTRYSKRAPDAIKSAEIIQERLQAEQRKVSLEEALKIAVASNRQYQFRKESLYLSALALTKERYDFGPKFSAGATATVSAAGACSIGRSSDRRHAPMIPPASRTLARAMRFFISSSLRYGSTPRGPSSRCERPGRSGSAGAMPTRTRASTARSRARWRSWRARSAP